MFFTRYWKVLLAISLLAVGVIALQSYKQLIVHDTIKEIEVETLKKNQVIRERTKDAVKENRKANPAADPSVALERLRNRQSD